MKTRHILASLVAAAFALCSCDKSGTFTVKGTVSGAADSMLYFENIRLSGIIALDSARLGSDGAFTFKGSTEGSPDFFRLRIGRQIINISADSTETITVTASLPTMATDYEVTGSDDCTRIRSLSLGQIALRQAVLEVMRSPGGITGNRDSINALIEEYKADVKTNYIYKDPKAASSYFALFQMIGSVFIFNPIENSEDIRAIAAVATAWDTYYPGAERTENLHNIAIENMRNERIAEANSQLSIDESKIVSAGLIEISLPDNKGYTRDLSALTGKVVMLDFHLFSLSDSPQRILLLRELYNKYRSRGFEIYQVSLDTDEHFWKQQTAALPWVSVHAPDGVASECVTHYNVIALPEFFLIDREGNLYKRSLQIDSLEEEIENLL